MMKGPGKLKYRVALVVVLVLLAFFGLRAFDAYRGLAEKVVYGKADIHSIRGWMNVDRVAKLYNADPGCICAQFNQSLERCGMKSLWDLSGGRGRRLPPDERQLYETLNPVYEKITYCMHEKPMPEDWMSMAYVPKLYSVDGDCVCAGMGLTREECSWMLVIDVIKIKAPNEGGTAVKDDLWRVVQGCPSTQGGG